MSSSAPGRSNSMSRDEWRARDMSWVLVCEADRGKKEFFRARAAPSGVGWSRTLSAPIEANGSPPTEDRAIARRRDHARR